MGLRFIRLLFIIVCAGAGFLYGVHNHFQSHMVIASAVVGAMLAGLAIGLESAFRKTPTRIIIGGLIGAFCGLSLARIIQYLITFMPELQTNFPIISLYLIFGYLGLIIGLSKSENFDFTDLKMLISGDTRETGCKILDTSVIIDGRIADICETGFLEGSLIIPQFVLKELQHIADSSDALKRNRGRRGLDILHKIQKKVDVQVEISEIDFPKIREVDAKLVQLAKMLGAKVVTNDFNLNKVAELQGVEVLNINELANALKPVVLPGEEMRVFVLKEGKEYGQGVAYLDDGTMVVVDNALKQIGKNIDVSVTSVLQTTAGRMIFSKVKEENTASSARNAH